MILIFKRRTFWSRNGGSGGMCVPVLQVVSCGTPTHQTRQQWTAKDVEKNRVSFKIITQNNKNVIFIGFDGQFDLKRPQKSKKKH